MVFTSFGNLIWGFCLGPVCKKLGKSQMQNQSITLVGDNLTTGNFSRKIGSAALLAR
jgi:hypothetical protein